MPVRLLRHLRTAIRSLFADRPSLPALHAYCAEYGPIGTIYDCGSRDALDGIALLAPTGASALHVFECNPPSARVCRANAAAYRGAADITINERAVADTSGELTFYPIDTEKTVTTHADGNPGASSLYHANPDYPHEQYVQRAITVEATSLDDYALTHQAPDLLWFDLQGAEVRAIQGAKRVLQRVRVIHTEVALRPVYLDQPLLADVDAALREQGFRRVGLFLGRYPPLPWLYRALGMGPWSGDAIYVNEAFA